MPSDTERKRWVQRQGREIIDQLYGEIVASRISGNWGSPAEIIDKAMDREERDGVL